MTTHRLYYDDPYLTTFRANVVEGSADGRTVYLDRTAFYPESGGQPSDLGSISDAQVESVIDEGERVAHVVSRPVSGEVECRVDWPRRFDHMQQHTGQHLLSAVFEEMFGIPTLSFHMGAFVSTIELGAAAVDGLQLERAELKANEIVSEARAVQVSYEDASSVQGLRKPSTREGVLRIVDIAGLDRSACGGTHVRSTGEIGAVLIRGSERIRGNTRIEFVCGLRAIVRARSDYSALTDIAQILCASVDAAPKLVGAQAARLLESEKARRKLALELATARGNDLYAITVPADDGVRRYVRRIPRGPIAEELSAEAQAFTARPLAMFAVRCEEPPSLLVSASPDTGVHAGNQLKAGLQEHGGRGGGSAELAQGSVQDSAALDRVLVGLGFPVPTS